MVDPKFNVVAAQPSFLCLCGEVVSEAARIGSERHELPRAVCSSCLLIACGFRFEKVEVEAKELKMAA